MSTDFNIKPVGAPVAAPVVQHVSEAAQHAVATQLPARQSVSAADAATRVNAEIQRRNIPNTYTASGQRAAPGPRNMTPLAVSRSL